VNPALPTAPRVAVVIPFFQRRPGVLARTLRSALDQEGDLPTRIIVVDDASPVPAEAELAQISGAARLPIEIVRRENGGPARARNTGLDHVPAGCPYVAFLDSDDAWQPGHLRRAVTALDRGFDLYCADWQFAGEAETAFARTGFDPTRGDPQGAGLWQLGESLFDRVFGRGNMAHLSTTVYRYAAAADLRFVPGLAMGEDIIFYLDLARRDIRTVVSNEIDMIRGAGEIGAVNIYEGSGWGSPRALWRLKEELRFVRTLAGRYPLSAANEAVYARRKRGIEDDIARAVLHRLRRGQFSGLGHVVKALAMAPGILVAAPRAACRRAAKAGS